MDDFKESEFWEMKLRELRLQETEMKIAYTNGDSSITEEDLRDLGAVIKYVRKEIASSLSYELKEEKEKGQGLK